jgi:cell division protein FtsL
MNEKNKEMKERYATEQVRKELAEEDRGYSLGLLVILLLVFLPVGVVYYLYSVKCKDLKKEIEILKSKIKEQEQPEEQSKDEQKDKHGWNHVEKKGEFTTIYYN